LYIQIKNKRTWI